MLHKWQSKINAIGFTPRASILIGFKNWNGFHTFLSKHTKIQQLLPNAKYNFMPTFKIQGQIYHKAGSLILLSDEDYKSLQNYSMGNTTKEIDQRCANNSSVWWSIVELFIYKQNKELQTMFHQHNQLITLFITALDLIPADNYKIFSDIVLHGRNDQLQRVYETNRSYDTL